MEVRLHKFLAHAGIASRRKCEEFIQQGLVKVNNRIITEMGYKIDPNQCRVAYRGKLVRPDKKLYFVVNKPKGYLCTSQDPEDRLKVIDLFKRIAHRGRLYTIGRLDAASEGLIIVTNDGELCQQLTHPRYRVPKTYWVVVRGRVNNVVLTKAQRGIWLAEGKTAPTRIKVVRSNNEATIMEITIAEGKKREIRRIFARFGHPVKVLKRIMIGHLILGNLKSGQIRPINRAEIISKLHKWLPKP